MEWNIDVDGIDFDLELTLQWIIMLND